MAAVMLCPHCLTQAKPKTYTKGSIGIELLAWLLFLIPGLFYSLWRMNSRYRGCPSCGEPGMIHIDTPRAQRLLFPETQP